MDPAAPRRSHRLTFAVLAVGMFSFALLQVMVLPVLPALQEQLGTTQAGVTWLLTANLLAAAVATPVIGRLGDMYGKQRLLVVSLVALGVGCLLAALASSLPLMLVGRVLQGIGGGVAPLSFSIVRDEFPERAVPRVISALSPLLAVGAAAGLVAAGPIEGLLGLNWVFWLPMIVVALAAAVAHVVVPESPVRTPGRINWAAGLLLSGWLVSMLLGVSRAPDWGWTSGGVLALLAAGVVLALLWVAVELRSAHPLLDLRLMRIRAVWTANLVAVLVSFCIFAALAHIPQLLQADPSAGYGFGATNTETGLILLPQSVASFVMGLSTGWLAVRFGFRAALLGGTIAGAVGYAMMALVHGQIWQVQIALVLMGAGLGITQAALANVIVVAVPREKTGVASGMYANIRTIGGSVGTAVTATVVTATAGSDGVPAETGYTAGFLLLTAVSVAAAVAALFLPGVRGARSPVAASPAAPGPVTAAAVER